MNELGIQTELVTAGNALGGHCFKAANRFKRGILDLSVQLPGYAHVYIEVKFERKFGRGHPRPDLPRPEANLIRSQPSVRLKLTPHQNHFIKEHEAAGGACGWLMVVGEGRAGRYVMDCSLWQPSHGVLYYWAGDNKWLVKEHGGKWPIEQIIRRLQR